MPSRGWTWNCNQVVEGKMRREGGALREGREGEAGRERERPESAAY